MFPTPLSLAEQLLYAVKTAADTSALQAHIGQVTFADLQAALPNDSAKKAFWINIYNAYYQLLAGEQQLKHPIIFQQPAIAFQDLSLSLDEVEHGILRRYRWKLSMGYLPNIFARSQLKQLAVDKIDYRIHFALNCGAKSCPPIAFYRSDRLEEQLQLATHNFLTSESQVDEARQTVYTTALFRWFRADFGSQQAIKQVLSEILGKDLSAYRLRYNKYDWDAQLGYFLKEG